MPRLLLSLLVLGPVGAISHAQQPIDKSIPPTSLILTPAAASKPALKYPLEVDRSAQVPGNAALCYHRALHLMQMHQHKPPTLYKLREWLKVPFAELAKTETLSQADARKLAAGFAGALEEIEEASRCSACDWGLNFREEGAGLSLPELEPIRDLSNVLSLCARVAMMDGDFERAIEIVRHGLVMARRFSDGPNMVQFLQSLAIALPFLQRLEELAQLPGSPNLYWSLTNLPQPFFDLRSLVHNEWADIYRNFPELRGLETKPLPEREVIDRLVRIVSRLNQVADGRKPKAADLEMLLKLEVGLLYDSAKQGLAAHGFKKKDVEALPRIQAVAVAVLQMHRDLHDDYYCAVSLPYWEGHPRFQRVAAAVKRFRASDEARFLPVAITLDPIETLADSNIRLERQMAALRCIEAIRIYAADHESKLPENLADITSVPIPIDPVTGKPFVYALEKDTAFLYGPPPSGDAPTAGKNVVSYRLTIKH